MMVVAAGKRLVLVFSYLGINLPEIWRRASSPSSLSGIEDLICRTMRLAVLGSVQQREFLRQLNGAVNPGSIEQAVLMLVPRGLDWLVCDLAAAMQT